MAVSSSTATALNPVQLVRDFLDGAIKGADGKSSIARTLGDLVGSAIPGYGQGRAFGDLWDGVKTGDNARTIAGLIGLIPMAGPTASAVAASGKSAAKVASKTIAEKGLKAGSMQLAQLAKTSAATAIEQVGKSKALRETIDKAGERAYGRAMELLQEHVLNIAAEGRLPNIVGAGDPEHQHDSFTSARDAVFEALDIKSPDASWQSVFAPDEERGKRVVGKHKPVPLDGDLENQISSMGFRFIEPDEKPKAGERGEYSLLYWKHPNAEAEPTFGIETFQASSGEAAKILDAYLNSTKKGFGRVKTSSN
jgi:hypothetical protein